MASGGAREGAGRPRGSLTKRTAEIAKKAADEGLTPLEVMIGAMRDHWAGGRKDDAAKIAQMAAPYMHPRLNSVEHTGAHGGPIEHDHDITITFVRPKKD